MIKIINEIHYQESKVRSRLFNILIHLHSYLDFGDKTIILMLFKLVTKGWSIWTKMLFCVKNVHMAVIIKIQDFIKLIFYPV